jgi:hypothetical protein
MVLPASLVKRRCQTALPQCGTLSSCVHFHDIQIGPGDGEIQACSRNEAISAKPELMSAPFHLPNWFRILGPNGR